MVKLRLGVPAIVASKSAAGSPLLASAGSTFVKRGRRHIRCELRSWRWNGAASITRTGTWQEVLEFVRLPLPLLRVGRGRFFDRNIWPDFRVFGIQQQQFLKSRFGVGLDRV